MKNKGLTAKQVEHVKPDSEKRIEVAAGPPSGLYLVVQPSGAKSWALRYRSHGRPRKMTLSSPYPALSLQAARAEAEAALVELEKGNDPAAIQAAEVAVQEMQSDILANVAEEWLSREVRPEKRGDLERIREKRWYETERILLKETAPWRNRELAGIAKPDVLRLLDAIVDRGASVSACRTRGVLIRFFKWARGRGYIEASPMTDVAKPGHDHESRDRVLNDVELLDVWTAAGTLPYPAGPFLRFLTLTAQRRGEVAEMRWRDVDLGARLWTLPKEATKAGRIHDVPLSPAAVKLLESLPRWTAGDFVWTSTAGAKPTNSFSDLAEDIRAAVLKTRAARGVTEEMPRWVAHDLRRTAATGMAKAGVPPHVLSAILNHTPGSSQGITSIYNRFRYTEERRAALDAWAHRVVMLATPPKAKTPSIEPVATIASRRKKSA